MRKERNQVVAILIVFSMIFSIVFENPLVVQAATKVLSNYGEVALTADEVSKDLYLTDVFTLGEKSPYVGVFTSVSDYTNYYAVSEDLLNWNIKSEYFSIVYGNNTMVGISSDKNYERHLNYTIDGNRWEVATLPKGISPQSVKYENGYFKLYCEDEKEIKRLYLSKDGITWFDITEEVPDGTNIGNIVIINGVLYTLTGTNVSGTGFRVHSTNTVNESDTKWSLLEKLGKKGYGMMGNFSFNGKTVGIQLYSIAEYEKDQYVTDSLYYVTDDFINWTEKDWTQGDYNYYSIYDNTSTAKSPKGRASGKRFEDIETHLYKNGNTYYNVSYIIYSVDGKEWKKDLVNIFVNGEKISKAPVGENTLLVPDNYKWAQKGIEYAKGRNYITLWDLKESLPENIDRATFLHLIMKALNVQAPIKPISGYVPFSDVYPWDGELINRAKMLGLVNGRANNEFDPYGMISRQDMMVMTYNILLKSGIVEADTKLTALQDYTDKDQVKGYAKEAVSSLIKEGIIKGSGNKINPIDNVSNAEAVTIAERLNVYRFRE